MDKEPVAIVGLIQALVLVLVAFGYLALTQQQVTALNGVIGAAGAVLIPLIGVAVARGQVTPVAKVDKNTQLIQAAADFHRSQASSTPEQVQETATSWGAWVRSNLNGQPQLVAPRPGVAKAAGRPL
jgi:hypothetical protein